MPSPLGELPVEAFLSGYWQKKPCLIRQAFPHFTPDFDGDDLAGLACEELAEARLVTGRFPDHDWTLRHGPFTEAEFATLPERDWTLLVQDVEKHYPPLCEWIEAFDFLPTWRIDDLMMSWAATGGSVGPHVDSYDVFLLQAEGRRRWQWARDFDPTLLADCPLRVLAEFSAEEDAVLEPGDMLYLPPGVAHHGVALEPGMTWSIGLRAPDVSDLLMAFGERLATADDGPARYADPQLTQVARPGEIDAGALGGLKGLMGGALDDDRRFRLFAAEFLSRFRLAQQPAAPEQAVSFDEVSDALASGVELIRNPWTRLVWVKDGEEAVLFAAGESFRCAPGFAAAVCATYRPELNPEMLRPGDRDTLMALINAGHLVLWD